MAKFVNDNNMDVLLNRIKTNAAKLVICQNAPTTYLQTQTAYGTTIASSGTGVRLGETTITSADFTGPANSSISGRKLQCNQQTGIAITVSSTGTGADHIALITTSTASELLLYTSISSPQPVTSGNTATVNAFSHHVNDPPQA